MTLSARNVIEGRIKRLDKGSINVEVVLKIPKDTEIVATLTRRGCELLELEEGMDASAVFKAANVMIALDAKKKNPRKKEKQGE